MLKQAISRILCTAALTVSSCVTATFASAEATHVTTDLMFDAEPVLVSGSPLEAGAIYQFNNVAAGLDARVKVVALNGVILTSIDDNATNKQWLQPVFHSLAGIGSVELSIKLFDSIQQHVTPINTSISVVGASTNAKAVSVVGVSDYTHELQTMLSVSEGAKNRLSVGIDSEARSVVAGDTRAIVSGSVVDRSELRVVFEASASGAHGASLHFSGTEYVNPVFHNTNDQPVATDDVNTFAINESLHVGADFGLLANDSDIDIGVDSDRLVVSNFSINSVEHVPDTTASINEGFVTIASDGGYLFVPAVNYSGKVTPIGYTVTDGKGGSAVGELSLSSRAM